MKKILLCFLLLGIPQAHAAGAGVWYPVSITGTTDYTTAANYTYGTKFQTKTSGKITDLKFWKSAADTTTSRNLILWSTSGTNLAECTTSSEPTGTAQWVGCTLTTAYATPTNTTYVVSTDYPNGSVIPYVLGTCQQAGGSAGATDPNNANLDCAAIGQFHYGALSTFPGSANTATTFSDIVFVPGGVPTPVDSSWNLIFDEEFNQTGDYTTLDSVWNPASGNNLRGGNYCWREHGITLNNHEIDLGAKSGCWVVGSSQPGEGARIATGPQASGATFDCSSAGVVSIGGVTQNGFCFTPGTGTGEIYAENLYDVPCDSSGNLYNHVAFWLVGNGNWAATNEFDVSQPYNGTQEAAELWYGQYPNQHVTFGTALAACGWHVFGLHWVGGSSPTAEFLVDGNSEGKITSNVTTAPQMMLLEYAYDGTPTTTSADATAKAIYVHVYGKNVTNYATVTPQTNYGGPGDTDGKTLGAQ